MSELLKNIIRFILLVLLQVFVLNQVLIYSLVVPSVYFLFLLLLPYKVPGWAMLLCGFLLGLCMDAFMNTGGIHAAACVLIAFLRPAVIHIFADQKGFESQEVTPSITMMGWIPFLVYAAILTFIHHVVYFTLIVFDFNNIFYLALKILLSTVLTLAMIMIYELLFAGSKSRVPV